jgi:RHS repeat-associated protein
MRLWRIGLCGLWILWVTGFIFAQSPQGLGRAPFGSYFNADLDSINLYNGNLMLDIPLFSLPAREGLSTGLRLTYNAQGWVNGSTQYETYGYYVGGWTIANPIGEASVEPYLTYCDDSLYPLVQPTGYWSLDIRWTDPSGSVHPYQYTQSLEVTPEWGGCGEFPWNHWIASLGNTGWLSTGNPADSTRALVDLVGSVVQVKIRLAENRTITFGSTWTIETNNGNYLTFAGDLFQDPLGRTITHSYGAYSSTESYRSFAITDANGESRTYQLVYENCQAVHNPIEDNSDCINNLLKKIILPNGRSYEFTYGHDQGFLTQVTLPSGGYIEYDYYNGNTSHNIDDNYVVARRVSADGSTEVEWTYTRSDNSGFRTVTETRPVANADDYVIVHTFDGAGYEMETVWKNSASADPSKSVETTRSGGQPELIVTTMDNLVQHQTFSWSQFRMTESTQSDWGAAAAPPPPNLTKTIYTNDSSYPFVPTQVELQAWNGTTYVTQGKTVFLYDQYSLATVSGTVPNHHASPPYSSRLNLTTTRRHADASNYVEEHFHYDVLGNVVEQVDARGKSTTIVYTDNFGAVSNQYSYAYPTQVTNAENHHVYTAYNFDTGLPVAIQGARSSVNPTTMTYDLLNRAQTITEPNGRVTTYTYEDDPANTLKVTEQVTVAEGIVQKTETLVDRLSRPIKVEVYDPAGNVFVDTEYDDVGQVRRASQPYRGGSPVWTETVHDVLGRPTSLASPDSPPVTMSYYGNTVTTTDEAGIQRRNTYNTLGQLFIVEEPNPTLSSPLQTNYSYYVFGPFAQVTQGDQTRTFTHDWLGRMTQEVHPETGTTTYTYDGGGLLLTRTASSVVATYTYDDIGRPLTIAYTGDDGVTPDVEYTYDQNGFTGLLTTAEVDGLTTSTFEYDDVGSLSEENVTLAGVTGTFATGYTYDLSGRTLTMTYPSGRVVTQSYANSGGVASDRTNTLIDNLTSATLLSSLIDNAAGTITARTLASGITETRTFNSRNQLTRIAAAAGDSTLIDMGYGYGTSNDGRIRSRTDAVQPEHSAAYTFDEIGRLTAVSGGDASWGINWTLDRYGNRTAQSPSGLATGRVGSQSLAYYNNKFGSPVTYDDAGNLTYDGADHFYYDAENRLYKINSNDVLYAYDYAGRRIKRQITKDSNTVTTYYFYGLTGLMSEFSTTSGASGAASTDRLQYRVGEQTGTAVMLMDSTGTPRENNRVFPFGEPWLAFAASDNKEKFTTYQHDNDDSTDLDYAMARYYVSRSGRFMTPDPGHVGAFPQDPQSWNAYAYVGNDPINRRDSTGLAWELCFEGANENYCVLNDTKHEYLGWVADLSRFGYQLPTSASFSSERFCVNGASCLTVRFVENGELLIRDLDKRVDASNQALVAFPVVTGFIGATGGLAAFFSGLSTGSGLTTLGLGSETILTNQVAGSIIGWGTGQGGVEITRALTRGLTRAAVEQMKRRGLTKSTVENLLRQYERAIGEAGKKLANEQLLPRAELMRKILSLW